MLSKRSLWLYLSLPSIKQYSLKILKLHSTETMKLEKTLKQGTGKTTQTILEKKIHSFCQDLSCLCKGSGTRNPSTVLKPTSKKFKLQNFNYARKNAMCLWDLLSSNLFTLNLSGLELLLVSLQAHLDTCKIKKVSLAICYSIGTYKKNQPTNQ